MARLVVEQAPSFAAFAVLALVFGIFAGTLGTGLDVPRGPVATIPATPIVLPPPDQDADSDTYADGLDTWPGDLVVALTVSELQVRGGADARPYLLVGTEDDQWRLGAGAAREWRRVVDHDPLGRDPGSPGWVKSALRTGAWWQSVPMEGARFAIATSGDITEGEDGVTWPQTFLVNVRDDRPIVTLEVELWEAARSPHVLRAAWRVTVDVAGASWQVSGGGPWTPLGQALRFGGPDAPSLQGTVTLETGLTIPEQREIAARWAPVYLFAQGERFFPTRGDALERFHGFAHRAPDHRTWLTSFNNGRDAYRLLLADFSGDGQVDEVDAALLSDVLRGGELAPDTVYAHVSRTTNGALVLQYWSFYFYNFVLDERGRAVEILAHAGDREFIQLTFADVEAARSGAPERVTFSQHYDGVSVPYVAGEPPFHVAPDRPAVFVARGSHASYPVAGNDEALRHSLAGFGDEFPGDGEVWWPDDYAVEVLSDQVWHAGYLWGPVTRHSRDLGTPGRPLLQHAFAYPFLDPLHWERTIDEIEAVRLIDLYRGDP